MHGSYIYVPDTTFSGINAAVVDIDGKEAAINILSKNLKPLKEETISITIPNYSDKLKSPLPTQQASST